MFFPNGVLFFSRSFLRIDEQRAPESRRREESKTGNEKKPCIMAIFRRRWVKKHRIFLAHVELDQLKIERDQINSHKTFC